MKRILTKIKQNTLGFIIGAILFGGIGVYATTILASQVIYTNNNQENVQNAIDDLYTKVKNPICKRATDLHTETCSQTNTSYYCSGAGYTESGSKGTTTITYGNQTITERTLTSGDAFDCDVNGDGTYDAATERFYFVSYKYIGGTTGNEAYDTNIATLIYYNNTSGGVANNTAKYAYNSDSNKINYNGPVTAVQQLPKTSGTTAWNKLKSTKRAILNELGTNYNTYNSTNYELPGNGKTAFDYSNYAARLLTAQEVNAACNITTGNSTTGELDTCEYLMENTMFSNSSLTYGYWLETPRSSHSFNVWFVYGLYRSVYNFNATTSYNGVRPAIEVSVTDIEY